MVHPVTYKPLQQVGVPHKVASDLPTRRNDQAQTVQPVAHHISLASALAQKGPPFDAERVASLQEAIANGDYRINLGAIADGIIRFGSRNLD